MGGGVGGRGARREVDGVGVSVEEAEVGDRGGGEREEVEGDEGEEGGASE